MEEIACDRWSFCRPYIFREEVLKIGNWKKNHARK